MLISSLFTWAVAFATLGSWPGGSAFPAIGGKLPAAPVTFDEESELHALSLSRIPAWRMSPSLSLVWTDLHAFDPARLVAPLSAVGQGKIGRLWRCLMHHYLRFVSDRHNGLGQTRPPAHDL